MLMAGIYSPDGRYAILTREAGTAFSVIHDRMPVINTSSTCRRVADGYDGRIG